MNKSENQVSTNTATLHPRMSTKGFQTALPNVFGLKVSSFVPLERVEIDGKNVANED